MTAATPGSSPVVSLATASGQLRVEFRWLNDRFVHQIVVEGRGSVGSIDGESDDPWPPSPPLQQLSPEQINGRDVILGVGAAGQSHWSISVESSDGDSQETLKFDVACRCRSTATWLGNTYQDSPLIKIQPLADSQLTRDEDGVAISPAESADLETTTRRWSYAMTLS